MELSIVATLYNSSIYVEDFCRRIKDEAEKLCKSYEIILVDDGSPDNSLDLAVKLSEQNSNVVVVELSRNHGHHRAMMVGLEHCCGDRVFLTDSDLEELPENLSLFWNAFEEKNADVIFGTRKEKKTPLLRKVFSKLFYKIFNTLSRVKIPSNSLVSRLMSKAYVKALLEYREHEIFLPGLWEDAGFKQIPIEVGKEFNGNSNYSFAKRIKLFVNALTSFSATPLTLIFYLGLSVSILSALLILYLVFLYFYLDISVPGWASIVVSVYFMGGIVLFSIGVIGAYLSKIFLEVKQRPNSIIKKIYGEIGEK